MEKYLDRHAAGKILAKELQHYAHQENAIVLALPRGGVPVAYEIAHALSLPLDVFIVRKLGVPWHNELAMGAIASGGTVVFNEDVLQECHIAPAAINRVIESETKELQRRELSYRGNRSSPDLEHKTIILVDDGIATGATMRAAIQALRLKNPASIIIAVPVAALDTCEKIAKSVEQLICPIRPPDFYAVGAWYENFEQTTDEEVATLLATV